MKRLFGVTLLLAALLAMTAPVVSAAPVVYVDRINGYYSGSGGEFTLTPTGWSFDVLSTYNSLATYTYPSGAPTGFESFCVEFSEHISIPGNYYVQLNSGAVNGGPQDPVWNPTGTFDALSVGTAWLYHEFQAGTLEGYKYNDNTPGAQFTTRALSAAALQDTIWWLEDAKPDPNNFFSNAIVTKFGSVGAAMADNTGNSEYSPVGVLNMWQSYDQSPGTFGGNRQDMLVCLPVPEPTTLLLLGAGLIGFAALRRRFTK